MVAPEESDRGDDGFAWWEDDDALLTAMARGGDGPGGATSVSIPGHHDLHELIRGGQGIVFTGVSDASGERVAIKVLRDDRFASDLDRRRFEREIDLASGLHHQNIVSVQESGITADGRRFLTMDYIEGLPLDEFVLGPDRAARARAASSAAWRLDVRQTLILMTRICSAIQYAHQRGVIHRDIKPANIRVDGDGEPHVLDFGLALAFGEHAEGRVREPTLTLSGHFVGSLAWSSPEQAEGTADGIDVRSDIYALGLLLHYLLTGRMPYEVDGPLAELLDNLRYATPTAPSQHRPVPADVDAIVLRCLAKDPKERYQSADELSRELRSHLAGEPIESRRYRSWRRMQRSIERYRSAALAVSVMFLALAGLLWVTYSQYQRALVAEEQAREDRREAAVEAANAKRTAQFLESLLQSVDPSGRTSEPTVRYLLAQAARRQDELKGQPDVQADILLTLGTTYGNLGDNAEAEPLLRRGIEILRERRKDASPGSGRWESLTERLVHGLRALGLTLQSQGRLVEAQPVFIEAIELAGALPGDQEADAVFAMIDLGVLQGASGDYLAAEATLREALRRGEAMWRPWDAVVGMAQFRLGQLLAHKGEYEDAEDLLNQSLEKVRRAFGPASLQTADCLHTQADLNRRRGRYGQAVQLAVEALSLYDSRLGRAHPRCVDCLVIMAESNFALERVELAIRQVDEAVEISRAVDGDHHMNTARALERRGYLLRRIDRIEEAIADYREALSIMIETLGPGHPDIGYTQAELGCLLVHDGEIEEGAELIRGAVAMLERGLDQTALARARACLEGIP